MTLIGWGKPRMGRHESATDPTRSSSAIALFFLVLCGFPRSVWSADDEAAPAVSKLPNIYLDFNTAYSSVPANALSFGFGNVGNVLASQLGRANAGTSLPASRNLTFNAPLTIDLTDSLSVFAGVSGGTSQTDGSSWAPLTLNTWNVGFTADVIQQHGRIPTVMLQETLTNPLRADALGLAATTLASVLEANYAFNEDQTEGVLAGIQYTSVFVTSDFAALSPTINPAVIGYVGGYYQWPNDWKLTGRVGLQSFGGAQIGSLIHTNGFTQPVVRLDVDKVDDNDNRLFGVSAEVAWTPQPLFQLTLRTPLYAVRNK